MGALPLDPARVDAVVTERWRDEVLPVLAEYVTIPCLSPAYDDAWERHGYLGAAAEYLATWCRDRALDHVSVEVHSPPGRTPVLLVEAEPDGPPGDTVLLYGHLDKQPPLGQWREGLDPYRPVIDGDRLFGRGTADDGYAVFSAMTALEAVARCGGRRPRVVVVIEASEESGSPDLPEHLATLAGRIGRPDLVVCLDSGAVTYDRLWLTSSLRGVLVGTVTVEVLTEGLHSGSVGGIVPSSFRALRQLLSRIEDERTGEIRLEALRAPVPADHERALRALAVELGDRLEPRLPTVPGLELGGRDAGDRLVIEAWSACLEVTGLAGAPPPVEAGNVLRPRTTAKLSIRLPPTCDAERAAQALQDTLEDHPPSGARVVVELEASGQGWVARPLPPAVATTIDDASRAHFGTPSATAGEGGSIPFLALLGRQFPDATVLATGVLGPGSNAHGPNESLHLPTATRLTACLSQLLAARGAADRPPERV